MRKIYIWLAVGLLGLAVVAVLVWSEDRADFSDVPAVNINRLNEGEAGWYAQGILDYRLLAQVEFSSEKRLTEILVRGGQIQVAQSAQWEPELEDWGAFIPMAEEEARFFSVEGLYTLTREALQNENVPRTEIRMQLMQGLSVPELLYFGDIIQAGSPVPDTALKIELLEFEELN